MNETFEPPLDPGIASLVHALRAGGIHTFESCQGGEGHAYPDPTVRFVGGEDEARRAIALASQFGEDVIGLRCVWLMAAGVPVDSFWELVLSFEPSAQVGTLVAARAQAPPHQGLAVRGS